MALSQSDFHVSISKKPFGAVISMTKTTKLIFSNTSNTQRGYNLFVEVSIPDGVSYQDSSLSPTSIINGENGTMILTWVNIKDLAPNETDFNIDLTLKADEVFRETGEEVPFDLPLDSVIVKGTLDTLPRGNFDIGNRKLTKEDTANFIPLRYSINKSAPSKMPKGAGLIIPQVPAIWPFQYTLTIENNSISESSVTLVDQLPNGVRYLGNLDVTGPDSDKLINPTITIPTSGIGCQDFVTIDWGNIVLKTGSVNVITFTVAIWNNYTVNCNQNSGTRIPHYTPLKNIARLDGESGEVVATAITNAMDVTIDKSAANGVTDVTKINDYSLTYRINQYDDVGSIIIRDLISDGQSYNQGSASEEIESIINNPDGTTQLEWNLGLLTTGTIGTITFSTTINQNYINDEPVSARDILNNNVDIDGINQTTLTQIPDSSYTYISIKQPTIQKQVLNYFYNDGTVKNINNASPDDEVQFRITYDAQDLIATQKDIEIDEYAPLNIGPLTNIEVEYGGNLVGPFSPLQVSPNGLRWNLGNLPGGSLFIATFKLPVSTVDFQGFRNNLAKLAGNNNDNLGYSDRDQVTVNFGKPDIQLVKTVVGPNVNDIRVGQTYTYSITISNPQNSEGTVSTGFEMDLTDVIPDGLSYSGFFNVVGTGTHTEPVFDGQNVSMTINKLEPDQQVRLNYNITVDVIPSSGQTFVNNSILQRPYSQSNRNFQYTGDPFEANAILNGAKVRVIKNINPQEVKVGDITTYTLNITIPEGTRAYNVEVIDYFEASNQQYIVGSAMKDGVSITPIINTGEVKFPLIPLIDASNQAVIILYTFDIRVINANHIDPFIDYQTNNVKVDWDFDEEGTEGSSVTNSEQLVVNMPNLVGIKEQRNITKEGLFTYNNIVYEIGDKIEYKVTIKNDGVESAFDAIITEQIDILLELDEATIVVNKGSISVKDSIITWNINKLESDESVVMTYQVTTLKGVAAGGKINNNVTFVYNSNNNGFEKIFGPTNSNTVSLIAPTIILNKQASINEGVIGNEITYTITATIPFGTIAYKPLIEDILPDGQTYIGPSTRQLLPDNPTQVIPFITNQLVSFPINNNIDASEEEKTIIYVFNVKIISASYIPPYEDIQVNTGKISWSLSNGGNLNKNKQTTLDILVKYPYITSKKEQRNVTKGGNFSTIPIYDVSSGDIIEYRITLVNQGTSTAYNIITTDVIEDVLTYIGVIAPAPEGSVNFINGTVIWTEEVLDIGNSIVLTFSVRVNSGVTVGDIIYDQASTLFDSLLDNPVTIGPILSDKVRIDLVLPLIINSANVTNVILGNTIRYTIEIIICQGKIAYDVQVTDILPSTQTYVENSLTRNGILIPSTTLEFPFEGELDATNNEISIVYTFDATVNSMLSFPQEIQLNQATINWNIEPDGLAGPPQTDTKSIFVTNSNIEVLKRQRNETKGGSYTTSLIEAEVGDILYYELTVSNPTVNQIYDVAVIDKLNIRLSYKDIIILPIVGTVEYSGGNVNWVIDSIPANTSYTMSFSVTVNFIEGEDRIVLNKAEGFFRAVDNSEIIYGPIKSQELAVYLPYFLKEKYNLGQSIKAKLDNLGDEIRLDLNLHENSHLSKATILGYVTEENGSPIEGAVVKVLDSNFNPLYHGVSDSYGHYFISDIIPISGLQVSAVKKDYYIYDPKGITLLQSQILNMNIVLHRDIDAIKSTIAGDVYNNLNVPISGLTVGIYKLENEQEIDVSATSTNQNGQFVFGNLNIGDYIIRITGVGYKLYEVQVEINSPSSITNLEIVMKEAEDNASATINGVIKDEEGNSVEGAIVILYKVTGEEENPILTPIKYTRTIQSGAYLFNNIPKGQYIVKANKQN